MTVLIVPGPVSNGIASGKTATLFFTLASSRSSAVLRALPKRRHRNAEERDNVLAGLISGNARLSNGGNVFYRLPLVDGICPAARSSISAAMRSARPNALNAVSTW